MGPKLLILGFIIVSPIAAFAQTAPKNTGPLALGDRMLLYQLAQEDMSEINLAKLATEKSTNPQVQSYANSILDNDPTLGQEAKIIAAQKRVTVPYIVNTEQKARFDRLSELAGADFDKAYMQYEAQKQQQDLKLVQQAANAAKDQDVKNYAMNETPIVLKAAQTAKAIVSSLEPSTNENAQPY
jgi:putative membrane protein